MVRKRARENGTDAVIGGVTTATLVFPPDGVPVLGERRAIKRHKPKEQSMRTASSKVAERRSRKRRSRESAASVFAQLAERRSRRRLRGRDGFAELRNPKTGRFTSGPAAAYTKRSGRVRSRDQRLPFSGLGERKRRSRRVRRSRDQLLPFFGLGERKRRSRRVRRSRESFAFAPRPSFGLGERKRRSRESFIALAPRPHGTGFGLGLNERRRRVRRSREFTALGRPYSVFMPRVREMASVRRTNGTERFLDLVKKAGVASVGLVGARALSLSAGKMVEKFTPSVSSSKYAASLVAAGTAGVLWWAGGQGWTPGIWRRNRELIALGAGLHFVEEVLGILLPMLGVTPGKYGVLGEAVYGSGVGGALGGCQYGCQWPDGTSPCPVGPYALPQTVVAAPGTQTQVLAPTPAALSGCQYGCQWPAGTSACPPQPGYYPPSIPESGGVHPNNLTPNQGVLAGLAGEIAIRKAGDAARDPFVANLLVQRAAPSQELMNSVGIGQ